MNTKKSLSSQAAYCRRRKQKILKKLKQLHDSKRKGDKFAKTSRLLERTSSEMSMCMNLSKA